MKRAPSPRAPTAAAAALLLSFVGPLPALAQTQAQPPAQTGAQTPAQTKHQSEPAAPQSAAARARALMRAGRLLAALKILQSAVQARPDDPALLFLVGQASIAA
ncbi:MAG: tetratricopeptide repeat protein, partial [Rhodospirillaceae bacterium]|nr:tetratricopeptide repeat protein [Rhodospirillaceae bacterium]